jgi:phosphatidate phosphatase APP1
MLPNIHTLAAGEVARRERTGKRRRRAEVRGPCSDDASGSGESGYENSSSGRSVEDDAAEDPKAKAANRKLHEDWIKDRPGLV